MKHNRENYRYHQEYQDREESPEQNEIPKQREILKQREIPKHRDQISEYPESFEEMEPFGRENIEMIPIEVIIIITKDELDRFEGRIKPKGGADA